MRMNPVSAAAAAVVLASLTLASCGGGSGDIPPSTTTVVAPPVVQGLQNARYQVSFINAATGAAITDPLKVSFVGAPVLKATDGSSLNDKTVTTSIGMVFVSADFTATADDFSVQVSDAGTAGWVPNGTRIVGSTGLSGDRVVEVKMVNTKQTAAVNASPEPIAMAVGTGTVTNGTIPAAITVTTAPKTITTDEGAAQTMGTASVAIQAGTVAKTATGAAAAPGALTVSNTYFSNTTVDALQAFPGGFAATVDVPAANAAVLNGVAADAGTFVTAGFAQFNVTDSAGSAIKTFDKPLTLGIDMPKGTLGDNGLPLAAGGQFPVWSYDDSTGVWKFETMGTVAEKTPVDPNNFTVQFQTLHLSTWALNRYVGTCDATINLTGRPTGDTRQLEVEVLGGAGQRFASTNFVNGSQLTLRRTPRITGTVIVRDRGTEVGRLANQNLCTAALNVPVTLPAVQLGKVRFETFETCSDGTQQRAVPTATALRHSFKSTSVYTAEGAYTVTSGSDAFAQANFGSVPAGTVEALAQNPRTGAWVGATSISGSATTSTVVTDGTTVFQFRFPMACQIISGGV